MRSVNPFHVPTVLAAWPVAVIFAIGMYLYRRNLTPPFYLLDPWDEASYIWRTYYFVRGDLARVPLSAFPLPSIFYSPFFLLTQGHYSWLLITDWLGRITLFFMLLLTTYLISLRTRSLAHPAVLLCCVLASTIPVGLLSNSSDALFSIFSGLAFWQLLAFYHEGRFKSLLASSLFLGVATLARTDGIVLAPLLVFLSLLILFFRYRLALTRSRVLTAVASCIIPFAAVVGGYLIVHGSVTGNYHTGTNIRSYYTFEFAQGWVYRDQYNSLIESYLGGFSEARRLYGTPEENGHSVLRAVMRNPTAFVNRVYYLIPQVPGLFILTYGVIIGFILIVCACIGIIQMLRRREILILCITLLWSSHIAVYLAFSLARPGYLLLPFFGIVFLASVGLTSAATRLRTRRRLIAFHISLLLSLVLLAIVLTQRSIDFIGLGLVSAVALLGACSLLSPLVRQKYRWMGAMSVSLLFVVVALSMEIAHPIPHGFVLGDTGEEQSSVSLRQYFRPHATIAASTPAVLWSANLEWQERNFEMSQIASGEALMMWINANSIDGIYMDYWMKAFAPTFYDALERQIGGSLEEILVVRDERPDRERLRATAMPPGIEVVHDFRVLAVRRERQ